MKIIHCRPPSKPVSIAPFDKSPYKWENKFKLCLRSDTIQFRFICGKVTSLKKKQYSIVNGKLAGRYCKFNCSSKNSIPRPL